MRQISLLRRGVLNKGDGLDFSDRSLPGISER